MLFDIQPSYLQISLSVTFSRIMKKFDAVKVITASRGAKKQNFSLARLRAQFLSYSVLIKNTMH